MRAALTLRQLEGMEGRTLSRDDIGQIKLTVAQGFSPDEPSNDQLNEWAARQVMGWTPNLSGRWYQRDDGSFAADVSGWAPSANLDQALRVAMETDHGVIIESGPVREANRWVTKVRVAIDGDKLHYGPFEPEVIARKIMLQLHRELER